MVTDSSRANQLMKPQDSHGTWLISFADLLVLLLCAFIMYFSQMKNADLVSQKNSGIKVAPLEKAVPTEQLEFFANDILESSDLLTQESIKVVKKAVDLGFYRGEVVTLSICNGTNANKIASKFLTLFREALVPEERLKVRFFGTECSSLGFRDNPKGALVAKIEIFNNG